MADQKYLKNFNNESWNEAIVKLHDPTNIENYKSHFYQETCL